MSTQKEIKHDPLGRYLNGGMAENAPSGFTEKVMSRVILEVRPLKARGSHKSYIPAVSLAVILILTGVAFALPSGGSGFVQMPWMKFFHNIELPALKVNLDSLLKFRLPGYLPYLFISILLLSIFDRALSGIFHREKKQQQLPKE